jgi:hypothetical protein
MPLSRPRWEDLSVLKAGVSFEGRSAIFRVLRRYAGGITMSTLEQVQHRLADCSNFATGEHVNSVSTGRIPCNASPYPYWPQAFSWQ